MSEIFSRRSIRYCLSVLVTSKRSSDFLLYKRSEQFLAIPLRPPHPPAPGSGDFRVHEVQEAWCPHVATGKLESIMIRTIFPAIKGYD